MRLVSGHEYTLPELIDIAKRENPQTRVAWEVARNAGLGAGIAASTYLPADRQTDPPGQRGKQ